MFDDFHSTTVAPWSLFMLQVRPDQWINSSGAWMGLFLGTSRLAGGALPADAGRWMKMGRGLTTVGFIASGLALEASFQTTELTRENRPLPLDLPY